MITGSDMTTEEKEESELKVTLKEMGFPPEWIPDLVDKNIIFMGPGWQEDETIKDVPFVLCNDLFYWGCSDGEDIARESVPLFVKAVEDCNGNLDTGSDLYCSRIRGERPQGACYTYIDKELWSLFDECGPERETGFGNPYAPGEYKR